MEEGTILVEGGGLGVACGDPNIFSALGDGGDGESVNRMQSKSEGNIMSAITSCIMQ